MVTLQNKRIENIINTALSNAKGARGRSKVLLAAAKASACTQEALSAEEIKTYEELLEKLENL